MNSSKSTLNIRRVWCDKCQDLQPKDLPHRCASPKVAKPVQRPCVFHTYPPGSSKCRGCGHIAGD